MMMLYQLTSNGGEMRDDEQQKQDHEAQQQILLGILNRMGTGMTNNEDKLVLETVLRKRGILKETA